MPKAAIGQQRQITKIETFIHPEYPKILFVRIHDDHGLVGLGETSFGPETVQQWIHTEAAPYLIGADPGRLDQHWKEMNRLGIITTRARGAEIRGVSALDMALWDLYAQRTGEPLYQVLGGLSRDRIRVYNTCAGYSYGVNRAGFLRPGDVDYRPDGPYEDQHAFLTDAGELAESLLSEGFTAMKIWPFDQFVAKTNGQSIHPEDVEKGVEPFRKIRKAVGDRIEIALEMHCMWNLPSAIQIARAVEPFKPMWYEDPLPMDNLDALAQFRQAVRYPVTASETVSTRWHFREMFERRAVDICMFDISWVGGVSEAKRVSTMAETYHLPTAPHDCVGPVTFMFSVQLSLNMPNTFIQETVRAYNATWYKQIVTKQPHLEKGFAYPPDGPGIGTQLKPSFLKDKRLASQESSK